MEIMVEDNVQDIFGIQHERCRVGQPIVLIAVPLNNGEKVFRSLPIMTRPNDHRVSSDSGEPTHFDLNPVPHGIRDVQSAYTYLNKPTTSSTAALNPKYDLHQVGKRAAERWNSTHDLISKSRPSSTPCSPSLSTS